MKLVNRNRRSRGFTIVELIVVLAIIAVLAILAVPQIRSFFIKGAIEPTGKDVAKIVANVRSNFAGSGGATPYATVNTAVCANAVRGIAQSLTVTGAGAAATLSHGLGATGATITCAPAAITTLGDSVAMTVSSVNEVACPGLAAQVKRMVEVISVNGDASVKPAGADYNGTRAQNGCTTGDTNTYVFTFQ